MVHGLRDLAAKGDDGEQQQVTTFGEALVAFPSVTSPTTA
jgi:hypothetical protein